MRPIWLYLRTKYEVYTALFVCLFVCVCVGGGFDLDPQFFCDSIKNKKDSENADTSTSVTFDVGLWPSNKVKNA